MAKTGEKYRRLREFLRDAFTLEEFETFVRDNDFAEVAGAVNAKAGSDKYFLDFIEALDRRGQIDGEFFGRLATVRDRKREPIKDLAKLWGVEVAFPAEPERRAQPRPLPVPAAPYCFGREKLVGDLVTTLLTKPPPPIALLGTLGIGKSTIALEALARVEETFGDRRYFVRCDSAIRRDLLVAEIARTMGIALGPNVETAIFETLGQRPAVLVLDNAETPWRADDRGTEELLAQLAAVRGLALVATIRSNDRPAGIRWRAPIRVEPLEPEPARQAFCAVAGEKFRNDRLLDTFLTAVDRMPLAIDLVARQAESEPNLAALWRRWQMSGTTILRHGSGADRLTNIERSIELSITSPAMSPAALRLLSLLGVLPDGIAWNHLDVVLPGLGEVAAANLRKLALAYDQSERLRVLAPIREYVHSAHPATSEDHASATAFYSALADTEGRKVGTGEGAAAVLLLAAELANIETMLRAGLDSTDPVLAIRGTTGLTKLIEFTGLGPLPLLDRAEAVGRAMLRATGGPADDGASVHLVADLKASIANVFLARTDHEAARARYDEALPLYRRAGDLLGEANCIKKLGNIALARTDHEAARARYDEALPLYRGAGDLLGEANCIKSLGNIALARSDHEAARARYDEALPLFRRAGSLLGEANCIFSLGNIALARSDHEAARARYDEALPLYRRAGSLLGEANCIKSLGDIALERSDHEAARARYDEALPLFRRAGSLLGEANCIKSLGDIALERSDHEAARARYDEALPLFRRAGDLLGEANCIQSLGDIALARSDHEAARARYDEALPLYRRAGDLLGEANCIQSLGDIALRRSDHEAARARFEEALALYARIPEPYSIGGAERRLARIAPDGETRLRHVQNARDAWMRINRSDLVKQLEAEFPDRERPDGTEPGGN